MKELKNLELDRHKGHEDDILSKTRDEGVFDEDSNCSKVQVRERVKNLVKLRKVSKNTYKKMQNVPKRIVLKQEHILWS